MGLSAASFTRPRYRHLSLLNWRLPSITVGVDGDWVRIDEYAKRDSVYLCHLRILIPSPRAVLVSAAAAWINPFPRDPRLLPAATFTPWLGPERLKSRESGGSAEGSVISHLKSPIVWFDKRFAPESGDIIGTLLWPVRWLAPDITSKWFCSAKDVSARPRLLYDMSRTSSTTSILPRYRWILSSVKLAFLASPSLFNLTRISIYYSNFYYMYLLLKRSSRNLFRSVCESPGRFFFLFEFCKLHRKKASYRIY